MSAALMMYLMEHMKNLNKRYNKFSQINIFFIGKVSASCFSWYCLKKKENERNVVPFQADGGDIQQKIVTDVRVQNKRLEYAV